ncbi:MAG TPA: 4'-phosphopantetheinyl transferase superfamily protein [Micromonospora sp.]|nr:4'-phosphopantetheinyl transferase superfamily protein [Micromonospora sp.]
MLAGLVPPGAVVVESFGDTDDTFLFAEEEAYIARGVDKRRREFTSARVCARAALAELGIPPAPIVPGPRGAPAWPAGVVGSMTHCDGYRAAAVALARDVLTIGIDAEPAGPLPDGILESIALSAERAMVSRLEAAFPGVHWDRLLFSAKEAVYKAWFPLTGAWLDFHEARIDIDPAAHTFTAALLVPGPVAGGTRLSGFAGRWLQHDGLVATAIVQTPR